MNKKRVIIFLMISTLISGTIFYLSSEGSITSNSRSDTITSLVENLIPDAVKKEVSKKNPNVTYEKSASYIVRKSAHFTLYGLLGLSLFLVFYSFNKKYKYCLLFAGVGSFIYACIDEYHQSFTGRTSSFSDVLLDTFGAICVCLLFIGIKKLFFLYFINIFK